MFKKLFLILAMVLCLAVGSVYATEACTLYEGTPVLIYVTNSIISTNAPAGGVDVVIMEKQPPVGVWEELSNITNEDWSDGIVVLDPVARYIIFVHKDDLKDCR